MKVKELAASLAELDPQCDVIFWCEDASLRDRKAPLALELNDVNHRLVFRNVDPESGQTLVEFVDTGADQPEKVVVFDLLASN